MSCKIAIISCKKIRGISCIGCIKCFKGTKQKTGEFARHEGEIEIVAMADCGDCPGLVIPKLGVIKDICKQYDTDYDTIHLGTCIVKAVKTAACPIDLEALKAKIEEVTGKNVIIGTHNY